MSEVTLSTPSPNIRTMRCKPAKLSRVFVQCVFWGCFDACMLVAHKMF
jgi:hypothetical protein